MTEVKTTQQRIYSSDHKLWVGMTRRDAYNSDELRTLFKSADVDGDGVLDQKNINHYDGPIFREKLTVKVGDSSGLGYGITSEGSGAVTFNSETVTRNDNADYYPGLKLEDLDEKHSIETFRKLDVAPTDGVITKDELKKAYVKKKKEDYVGFDKTIDGVIGGVLGGGLGGILGAIGGGILESLSKTARMAEAGTAVWIIGSFAGLATGIYLGIKHAKNGGESYEKKLGAEFDEKAKAPGTVYEDMLEPRYIKE